MTSVADRPACVGCGRGESEAVLLAIRFRGDTGWMCSQCFPMLIHNPKKLAGRLEGAETLRPADGDHE
ncbi:MAG: hypothetical protein NTU91_13075 [Chloroflexi bacterium]|nr:hypothetical protein [Chloroflexota bacterium]